MEHDQSRKIDPDVIAVNNMIYEGGPDHDIMETPTENLGRVIRVGTAASPVFTPGEAGADQRPINNDQDPTGG